MFCYWTIWNSPESLTPLPPRLRDQHQRSWFVLFIFKEEFHSENNFRASFFPSLVWTSFQGDSLLLLFRNGARLTRTAFRERSPFSRRGQYWGRNCICQVANAGEKFFGHLEKERKAVGAWRVQPQAHVGPGRGEGALGHRLCCEGEGQVIDEISLWPHS